MSSLTCCADLEAAHPFPAMQKTRKVFRIFQPDQTMDMVWHDDEANAFRVNRLKLVIEDAENDALGLIEIEELAILEYRKSDEMDVALVGEAAAIVTHATGYCYGNESTAGGILTTASDNLQADFRFCLLTLG